MAVNWDFIIAALLIIGLILTMWAKVSKQTIPKLLRDLTEYFKDTREDLSESRGIDLYE